MAIKRRKVDTRLEQQILTGMIISDTFLVGIRDIYSPDLFELKHATLIAEWCFGYHDKYEQAPLDNIEDLFFTWCKTDPDEELEKYVTEFLANLSSEFEDADKFNAEYWLDKTIDYFNIRSIKILADGLKGCVATNDPEEAGKLLNSHIAVERALSVGVDPFTDKEAIKSSFLEQSEPLFKVPGALGRLMNLELTRDSFISIMAPEKRGKTWILMFFAMQARKHRCKVAFFQAGDLSQSQMIRRFMIYLAQKSDRQKYCGKMYIPVLDCIHNQEDTCSKKFRTCDFGVEIEDGFEFDPEYIVCTQCSKKGYKSDFKGAIWYRERKAVSPLTPREAYEVSKKYNTSIRAEKFKLATYANRTLNVEGIERQLDIWERTEGFVPDVIITDYSDIFAPERGSNEFRHQQNETWMALRRLSQKRHACVINATQASASAYEKDSIDRSDYSEDKRKYAHVTAMYALNQTPEEKSKGLMRVAPILVREDDFDERYNVRVLQCLQIGRPYIASF